MHVKKRKEKKKVDWVFSTDALAGRLRVSLSGQFVAGQNVSVRLQVHGTSCSRCATMWNMLSALTTSWARICLRRAVLVLGNSGLPEEFWMFLSSHSLIQTAVLQAVWKVLKHAMY